MLKAQHKIKTQCICQYEKSVFEKSLRNILIVRDIRKIKSSCLIQLIAKHIIDILKLVADKSLTTSTNPSGVDEI